MSLSNLLRLKERIYSGSAQDLKPEEFLQSKFPDFSIDSLEGTFTKPTSVGSIEYSIAYSAFGEEGQLIFDNHLGFAYSTQRTHGPHITVNSFLDRLPLLAHAYKPVYMQSIDEVGKDITLAVGGSIGNEYDLSFDEEHHYFERTIMLPSMLTHEKMNYLVSMLNRDFRDLKIVNVEFQHLSRKEYKNLGIPPEKVKVFEY